MRTSFDCIPCFIRQALDSVRLVTDDETVREELFRIVLSEISQMDMSQSPPAMVQRIHCLIQKLAGKNNPHPEIKNRINRLTLEIYPKLLTYIERLDNPLEAALRIATGGNFINYDLSSNFDEIQVCESIKRALTSPFEGDVEEFSDAVAAADDILYLADNAGEIFFDRLLITQISWENTTFVIRGFPGIGDTTMDDARVAGITRLVEVIDSGAYPPGTILSECSRDFRRRFEKSDLIIAKGQGNYETLSEVRKDIFFLLKVNCPVIASDLGCQIGSLVLRRSTPAVTVAHKNKIFVPVTDRRFHDKDGQPIVEWDFEQRESQRKKKLFSSKTLKSSLTIKETIKGKARK